MKQTINLPLLKEVIERIKAPGKGILAADESIGTITKRFEKIGVKCDEESRRKYRELLFTAAGLEQFIGGVILFEETFDQKNKAGKLLPEVLLEKGILPGIKVDKGKVNLANTDEEVTQGLDDLGERLELFKSKGARFAKWRALYQISEVTPSDLLIESNAHQLACYAALCQTHGLVPIVEPEVLIDGEHTIKACAEVSEKVLHAVFHELHKHRVLLEGIILKPSMVMPGKNAKNKSTPEEVAHHTLEVFRRVVPAAVPTINFLSGGQTPEEATYNLNAMNANPQPWRLSFSYARALQGPCMEAWRGQDNQIQKAQEALLERARLNSLASEGK